MTINNQHRAILLTILISFTLFLVVYNLHLGKIEIETPEQYYDILPEDSEEHAEIESLEYSKIETNKAYDQNQQNNRLAHAYKPIEGPKDYIPPQFNHSTSQIQIEQNELKNQSKMAKEQLDVFNQVNSVLDKHVDKDVNIASSSVSYSLQNRVHVVLPTPRYLCQIGGKIVINITVNAAGKVINTIYNKSSNSKNQCLIDHALEYARKAQFNPISSQASQLGSITFTFKAKG